MVLVTVFLCACMYGITTVGVTVALVLLSLSKSDDNDYFLTCFSCTTAAPIKGMKIIDETPLPYRYIISAWPT